MNTLDMVYVIKLPPYAVLLLQHEPEEMKRRASDNARKVLRPVFFA
jgi:hypothetical protein